MGTASPADYINCPKMFSQQDWTCKGNKCEITCNGSEIGFAGAVNPMDIILGTIPRVYDNRQGDHTYQVQCNCRKNAVCSFSGYTLPSCMAAKQHLENASLRGRSGMMFGSKPIHSESFNINLNLVDIFNNKAVSIKA